MSAFLVSEAHIDALIHAGINYGKADRCPLHFGDLELTDETASAIGNVLWEENRRSLEARYGSHYDHAGSKNAATVYTYKPASSRRDPVIVLKLIDCYEYQSCEHEGWESSAAHKFCEELRRAAINALPGYENAPWGI